MDSLLTATGQTKNDSARARFYNKVGFAFIFNDAEKAQKVLFEGLADVKHTKFDFGLTELINTYGIYMDVTGQSDAARIYIEKAPEMALIYAKKDFDLMKKFPQIESFSTDLNPSRGFYSPRLALKSKEHLSIHTSWACPEVIDLVFQ